MAALERQFGPTPSAAEDFSLWLAAVSPLAEGEKVALLRSQDSLDRLDRALTALTAYHQRLLARQQAVAMLSSAGTGVVNATSSLGRLVASLLSGSNNYNNPSTEEDQPTPIPHPHPSQAELAEMTFDEDEEDEEGDDEEDEAED